MHRRASICCRGAPREMEQAVSENENTELREQVRARYAQAATAVTTGTRNADLLVEETSVSSCCSSTSATEGSNEAADDSCCAPTKRSFGAGLYDEATAAGLPLEAVEARDRKSTRLNSSHV